MPIHKFLSWIAVILWMALIFNLSSQVAEQSNQLSTGITEVIVQTLERVAPNRDFDIGDLNHIVRKNAHFFAYLILGLLVINALRRSGVTGKWSVLSAFLICVLYAISDEVHQLFVPGRGGQVKDVVIDSAGALMGIGLYTGFISLRNKARDRNTMIIISSLVCILLLYVVEQILQVDYLAKTLVKIILFTCVPLCYVKWIKGGSFKSLFHMGVDKKHFRLGLIFGILSFSIVLVAYYLLKDMINLDGIMEELQNKGGITPVNFLIVGVYITFGNSFLEEFFFRGFIFLNLYELKLKKTAYLYSSTLFAVYHIVIFKTWFNIWLTGLALLGLFIIGLIFNWLDTKSNNFINSWIVHIFADIAIILIGLRMFGMLSF